MPKLPIMVPYNHRGDMMDYDNGFTEGAANSTCGGLYGHHRLPAEEFYAIMRLDGMYSGRSAKGLVWIDDMEHRYQMFVADLVKMLQAWKVDALDMRGWWIPCKRGANFGVRYVRPDGDELYRYER